MLALIDGDIIVYSVGFATQNTYYEVEGVTFDTKKEATVYCKDEDIDLDKIEPHVEAEDVTHAYHNAKKLINKICDVVGADEYEVYLTGAGNYRDAVATIQPYKGNRDKTHKPVHYTAIKEYLINVHGAETIEGMEADDKLGIMQTKAGDGTVICTIDKDLDMIAGEHYNWRKDERYYVSEDDGDRFFYTQLLTGDATDNIRGVPQIGKVKAAKILKGCTSNLCAYNRVRQTYLDYTRKESSKINEIIDEETLLYRSDRELRENADLLWILRESNTLWEPPTPEETTDA